VLLALVVLAVVWNSGGGIRLEDLAAQEARWRALEAERPMAFIGVAFGLYVLIVGLSLPGASILTPLVGWFFGLGRGIVFASFAATAGATCAMLLSRYVLRDLVRQRFGERLAAVDQALEREGAWYLFALRLVPAVPFFAINLMMGLTRMRVWTFWWVSQLGMLPGTCVFVYAGASVPTIEQLSRSSRSILSWKLAFALTAVGLLPLGLRYLVQHVRGSKTTEGATSPDEQRTQCHDAAARSDA
jgi:uncharacterized membrane protein YdjX (TVP38/TMEM64 family)